MEYGSKPRYKQRGPRGLPLSALPALIKNLCGSAALRKALNSFLAQRRRAKLDDSDLGLRHSLGLWLIRHFRPLDFKTPAPRPR